MSVPVRDPSTSAADAFSLMQAGQYEKALPLAQAAAATLAECSAVHGMLATLLCHLGRRDDAESVVSNALLLAIGTADAYDALAHVSISLGRPERAMELYRRATEIQPHTTRFWYNLASTARSLGYFEVAETACNRSIAADRSHFGSYLLRSELRAQTPISNHLEELRAVLSDPTLNDRGRSVVGYALAKELDDLDRFDEAFRWFSEAARARRRSLSYDVSVDERKLRRITESFPSDMFQTSDGKVDAAQFIFIVGLPRSGTTLLERILSGLPAVRSNGETENFSRALLESTPTGHGDVFARAARADPDEVAHRYVLHARASAKGEALIEKLPMNYLYLGAIHRALPRAKLLWLTRSPLDSCFAMYRTLFGSAYPFSYDFDDLARYYAAYDRLMRHWLSAFGRHVFEVRYEELATHPEVVAKRVAEHCELQWESMATRVDLNGSASFTASASQARRPIYQSSIGKYRHYGNHLHPLARKLEDLGVSCKIES